ncbi:MAG TPA: T9SS type A sorting domain-containing protein [Paludibacteraceae bacterium]|nr:T9SS type A sorting domain-containing protein [Paludibacteraceae bacterium]
MRRIFLFGIGLILPIAMFAQGALMAGAIKNAKDTLYTNGTPNAVEEETPASGGDGNYSYRWVISGCTAQDSITNTPTFTPPIDWLCEGATATITRFVKSGTEVDWTASAGAHDYFMWPQFTAGSINFPTDTFSYSALPQSVTINSVADAAGGDGNIQYQWKLNDVVIAGENGNTLTYNITDEGTFRFSRWAKDGGLPNFLTSGEETIVILPKVEVGSITPQAQTDTFNFDQLPVRINIASVVDATGGDGNIEYQWQINGTVVDTATTASYNPLFTENGDFTISRWAKDGFDVFAKSGEYKVVILSAFNPGTITAQTEPDTVSYEQLPKSFDIASVTPTSGGDGNIEYQWKINDILVAGATSDSYTLLIAKLEANSGKKFTVSRWAKDGHLSEYKKSGEYTIQVLREFSAGEITANDDTVCAQSLPRRVEIKSVQDASGGDGNIQYRWTLGAPNGDPGQGEVLPVTSAILDTTLTQAGTYIFYRWAKDGVSQREWKASNNSYAVTIYEPFSAGALPLIYDTLCYTNTESHLDIVLGSLNDASGGNGKIDYMWTVRCDWKKAVIIQVTDTTQQTILVDTTAYDVINNAAATEIYRFAKGNVKDARFPMTFTFYRYSKDTRCNPAWEQSVDSIKYIVSDHQAQATTVYICECDFPYTYTYTYLDNHTEDVVFQTNGEKHIMPDFTIYGCNKPVTLTGVKCLIPEATVNDIPSVCETTTQLSFKYTITKGVPSRYKLEFDSVAKAQGFEDVPLTVLPKNGIITINKPAGVKAGVYGVNVFFTDTRPKEHCTSQAYKLGFTLMLDSYVRTKWSDVIFVDNNEANTGVKFTSFQWYRNGNLIEGATEQYYYQEGGLDGTYHVVLQTADGKEFISCEKKIVPQTNVPDGKIITYPVPAETNTPIIVELPFAIENLEKGQIDIYNSVGILVKRYTNLSNIMQIQPIAQKGVYILKLTTSDGKAHTTKFMVK